MYAPYRASMRRSLPAIGLALLSACGSDYGKSSGPGGEVNRGGGPIGTVKVGASIQFASGHNGSAHPAVDTIAAGGTVTWTWTGTLPHSVRSIGTPAFASSGTKTGSGSYTVTFPEPGTYRYDCIVHGSAMTGTIVVAPAPVTSATVRDSIGDTFQLGGVQWDLTALTVSRDSGGVTVALDFASEVISPTSGDPSALVAFVDLDVDQDPVTGGTSVVDEFRRDHGSTGLGVDAFIEVSDFAADSSVAVTDGFGFVLGRVKPVFAGSHVTLRVPRAILGDDDGFVNAAAIVGGSGHPSDFVPGSGHLSLGAAGAALVARATPVARRVAAPRARASW